MKTKFTWSLIFMTPLFYAQAGDSLYDKIVRLDSLFFDAYNHCSTQLDVYANFYADDLEFYHDQGGLTQSKQAVVEATRQNICGKVTRHLKPGSIEVYPIKNWGAIETGMHHFRNGAALEAVPHDSKFIIFWRETGGAWKISKVVSLH